MRQSRDNAKWKRQCGRNVKKVQMLQDSGADRQEVMLQKAKYQGQLNEYASIFSENGIERGKRADFILMDEEELPPIVKTQNKLFPPEMIQKRFKRYRHSTSGTKKFWEIPLDHL